MNLESAGAGAGGGFIIAILSYLGFKQRIDKLEIDLDKKVATNFCSVNTTSLEKRLDRIEVKIDTLLAK